VNGPVVTPIRLPQPSPATILVHDATEAGSLVGGSDRCDRCGARAFVVCLTRTGQELLFCGHCYHTHEAGLVQTADSIHDCRVLLLASVRS
jgi:hypothetical protein